MGSFVALLLLTLISSFSASSADVSWNIDCGASSNYTDDNKIKWTGDGALTAAGEPFSVPSSYSYSDLGLNTLRAFTHGKRNCYLLNAEKGAKVLLRANFYYGNYDGKSCPPIFDVEIDGNDWITMQTSFLNQTYDYFELVYVTNWDTISVCFLQTQKNHIPFVSSLQIQSLPSSMYQYLDLHHALFFRVRYAFGANESISYPDDSYGRIWDPASIVGIGYSTVARSNASAIDKNIILDKPPRATMDNAMTTSNSSARSMTLPFFSNMPTSPSAMYINMYFTEVTDKLNSSTQRRSFHIYVNNTPIIKSVTPVYGNVTEISLTGGFVGTEDTTFTLVSTNDSTLPPVISAVEVFQVLDYNLIVPTNQTTSEANHKPETMTFIAIFPVLLVFMAFVN